jgi:molybdopterin converting factor small subunit
MQVVIPSHLESYTAGERRVEARGSTLAEVVADLDRRYPGLRFRIVDEQDRVRPHIKLFVGSAMARSLDSAVAAGDTVTIVAALSGG